VKRFIFIGILFSIFNFQLPIARAQQGDEQMASYYYQNREYDKAIELYEPLYARTQSVYYYQMLYTCYLETEQFKEAEKLVEKRMKRQGRDLTLYVDLGNLHLKRGERKKAEKQYAAAVDKLGRDSKQAIDLALAFENSGRTDYAIATFLRSRQNLGNELLYVMELATLYGKSGQYDKMTGEYFNLLDHAPGNIGAVQIALQRALNETSSTELADGLRRTLVSRIREHPDNRSYLDMMIWFSLQQKDFDFALTQAKAVDARFPDQGGQQVMRVAHIAANNEAYDVASAAYKHLIAKGKDNPYYFDSRVGDLEVRFARINTNFATSAKEQAALEAEYESAIAELGKMQQTVPLMRNYAHLLAYGNNASNNDTARLQKAADLLYDIIEMPRVAATTVSEVKLDLGDLLLFSGEVWDASLLYSQVEKANRNDVVGAMAKFKNAKLSYYNNDFQWAKTQLDVLRASTSKLIANDAMQLSLLISDNMEEDSTYETLGYYAAADLMLYRGQLDSAWSLLNDIEIRNLSHSLLDEVLMQKARIRMKQARYAEADSLLQRIVDHYSEDILADDALFMLAELNEQQLGNKVRARECYEKLILDHPASLYTDRARKRYNALKTNSGN
jgi:predicted Zn-dependent protease